MAVMELVAMELAITLHGRMNMADSAGTKSLMKKYKSLTNF
jgi:hypothetical protein